MQQPPRFPLSSRTQPPSFPESKVAEVPVRILIEARQLDIRDMMASHLRSLGYECKIAETPGDAMETIESGEKFDLVCCDLASWPEEKFWHLQRGKTHVLASIAVYDTC
jgi:DNA-binding NtrC family response regulator